MREWFIEGSDPGLCVTTDVSEAVMEFGRACKTELVTQNDAVRIVDRAGISLEGLGGTNGGIIGALVRVERWEDVSERLSRIRMSGDGRSQFFFSLPPPTRSPAVWPNRH